MEMMQLDFKWAFLCGKLDEVIHLEQLSGCVVSRREKWVYRLLKALNGLKKHREFSIGSLEKFHMLLDLHILSHTPFYFFKSRGTILSTF